MDIFCTKKWMLEIISSDDLSSNELDELLVPENISSMTYTKDDGTVETISGYDTVDTAKKKITSEEIILTIKLLKEITKNES